jgi:hypothetical protein
MTWHLGEEFKHRVDYLNVSNRMLPFDANDFDSYSIYENFDVTATNDPSTVASALIALGNSANREYSKANDNQRGAMFELVRSNIARVMAQSHNYIPNPADADSKEYCVRNCGYLWTSCEQYPMLAGRLTMSYWSSETNIPIVTASFDSDIVVTMLGSFDLLLLQDAPISIHKLLGTKRNLTVVLLDNTGHFTRRIR